MIANQKKILIYKTELEKNHAFGIFLNNLGDAFCQLGYDVIYADMNDLNQIETAINMLMRNEIFFSVAMNANMLEIYGSDKPIYLYNYVDTCHISLLQDAPYSVPAGRKTNRRTKGIKAICHLVI